MASLNKVQIIGHLGADPDVRYLTDGDAVTTVSIATSMTWKDKDTDDKKERTEWHRVTFFGKLAEVAGEYLKKGGQVYVEGRLQTDKWQDKEGIDRYTTKIVANNMLMLGSKGNSSGASQPAQDHKQETRRQKPAPGKGGGASFDDMDDDIPF